MAADGPAAVWRLGRGLTLDCAASRVAGIVNVTPDSFYDGGRHNETAAAVAHGQGLAAAGADMLDVGGESTRPGAPPVPLEEELRRVVPVIAGLAAALPGLPLAVDTYKAGCAAAALEAGAVAVNDVSACSFDPGLLEVVASHKPGYVLMHSLGRPQTMQDDPRYDDVVEDILRFFEEKLAMLVKAGLPEAHVVVDPGVGFGKRPEHNLAILRHLGRFASLGRPVYLGVSNKSVFGAVLKLPVERRDEATAVVGALCAGKGARIHRVHDVARTALALRLAAAIG
ncbi:MAG: dihydropteroate synthase [Solidesulfovibrio sp. DCME]|uniref:dihydropteroate synthase n=1 Tax=Solidesulfovibrio sp. DCME TaxID=3447380 RepID=UPI003D09ABF5